MRVFACKNQNPYGGGLIIVAANNIEEAILSAAYDKDFNCEFHFENENGSYIEPDKNPSHVRSENYPFDKWYEIESLTANVDKPQVIDGDDYYE